MIGPRASRLFRRSETKKELARHEARLIQEALMRPVPPTMSDMRTAILRLTALIKELI